MTAKGTLFIISAPSGGGKTSLVQALLMRLNDIVVSISHTTRSCRVGELEGINYYFVDQAQFKQLIEKKAFLEYAEVFGYYYGTTKQFVEEKLRSGVDVILEIDWQGAQQVRQSMPDCVSIFILPPSRQILEQRLRERASDDSQVIARRLQEAKREIAHSNEFDYWVINDDFSHALGDLVTIIQARRLRREAQEQRHTLLLEHLLSQ